MPITFTAYQDKKPGSWGYILFTATSMPAELDDAGNYIKGSILEYSIIEYAGSIGDIGAAVRVNASNLLVDHSTISHSASRGISVVESGEAVIRNSTIRDNKGSGIYIFWCGSVTITDNAITGNTASNYGGGIYIYQSKSATITNNTITVNTAPKGAATYLGYNIKNFSRNIVVDNKASGTTNTSAIYIASLADQFKNNSIYDNKTDFDIYYAVGNGVDMDATGNYWGTTDVGEVGKRIYDFAFDVSKGFVNFVPFLNSDPNGPSEPTGLALTVLNASSVELTWNANLEPDVAGYKVYYDTDTGAPYEGKGAKEGDSPIDVKKVTSYTLFSDPDAGDSHKASQWQITTSAGDYANPVYDSGRDTNKTKIIIPAGKLTANTTYYWRVRHQDSKGAWSDYSAETSFTTKEGIGLHRFVLELAKGANIISLPLKPDVPYTARSFAQKLDATVVIKFDLDENKLERTFIPFITEANLGDGFSIEGGKGYIVNVLEAKSVPFEGTAWGEEIPQAQAPSIISQRGTWAFVVAGLAHDADVIDPETGGYTVTVTNKRTGTQRTAPIGSIGQGRFAVVFADLNRRSVVEAGDEFQITVTDRFGKVIAGQSSQRVEQTHIDRAYLTVNLRIGDMIPTESVLLQNYPNPFNPETWIPYQIDRDSDVTIRIYNVAGQLVRTLSVGHKKAGFYMDKKDAAHWEGKNQDGEEVASGIYFYRLEAGNFSAVRKLVISK